MARSLTKTAKKPAAQPTAPMASAEVEVEGLQEMLTKAKQQKPKQPKVIDARLYETARPPLTQTYDYAGGIQLTVKTDRSGQPVQLSFSTGRTIALATGTTSAPLYTDSMAPGVRLSELTVDADGSLLYKRNLGKRSAIIKETASGAKYATLKLGRETREIALLANAQKVIKGKEGVMTVSPDGSLVSIKPKAGGTIEVYPWVKLVAVEFPDGHKQTFYASDRELGSIKKNPIGFYVNWLPTDSQGHHFEWGTLASNADS